MLRLSPKTVEQIIERRERGQSVSEIANALSIGTQKVSCVLDYNMLDRPMKEFLRTGFSGKRKAA